MTEPRDRPPTIYDVAEAAGVAASTVSRAFSRPGRVNAATAERIRSAANRLGYRVNPLARALPTGRSRMIALMVSDITNPFYFELIRGAQSAAADAGYTMLLADAQESDVKERESLERAVSTVDGIVLASTRMSDSAIRMTAKQLPMVVLNRAVADVPSLITDNPRGARLAMEHLVRLGHSSVTYVAGPEASWADGVRWRTMHDVGAEYQLSTRRIGPFPPTVAAGERAADAVRARSTTAVIAYNDQIAIGVIRGLAAAGLAVPADVSVIGFDNIMAADLITPRLTTVAAPLHVLGVTAVQNLLAFINGAVSRRSDATVLPVRLVERASTGPPGRDHLRPTPPSRVGGGRPRG